MHGVVHMLLEQAVGNTINLGGNSFPVRRERLANSLCIFTTGMNAINQ
jgi:hypothetical protein